MHKLSVSFLIISLTMILCSGKVKRLALKGKKKINMWQVYIECTG